MSTLCLAFATGVWVWGAEVFSVGSQGLHGWFPFGDLGNLCEF